MNTIRVLGFTSREFLKLLKGEKNISLKIGESSDIWAGHIKFAFKMANK